MTRVWQFIGLRSDINMHSAFICTRLELEAHWMAGCSTPYYGLQLQLKNHIGSTGGGNYYQFELTKGDVHISEQENRQF